MTTMDFGNARVRAMRSHMLQAGDYSRLAAVDTLARLLGVLAETDYGPDVEAAIARGGDLWRLDDALKRHAVRRLGVLPRFYEVPARDYVELLLMRHELENLLTIVRGHAGRQEPDRMLALVVPLGRVSAAELGELARMPSLRAAVDLMASWGIPSRRTARRVLAAWPRYEAGRDPVVLELALQQAYAEHLDRALETTEGAFVGVLRTEVDQRNVLIALRLREARLESDAEPSQAAPTVDYLVGGRIRHSALEAARLAPSRGDASQALLQRSLPAGWQAPLAEWTDHGDLVRLTDDLGAALARTAVGLFAAGDPLGLDIPTAFTWAKETEIRNLRWIGRSLQHGLPPGLISEGLVMP